MGEFEMKNRFNNLILKTAIILWAVFIILILVSFVKFETPNSNLKLQTGKLDQIEPLIENNIHNLAQEIENESLQPIATLISEPTAPEYFYYLSDYERWLVESIIAGEAGIESYEGKLAIANCIYNACIKEKYSVERVVENYGYHYWKDINDFKKECLEVYGNINHIVEIEKAVSQIFDNNQLLNNEILFFYSPKNMKNNISEWHESQKFIIEIGNHKFFGLWN